MTAYLECPSFESCSVNDCPLADGTFESLPEDPETECKARISTRQRIAAKYNLSNGGLTHKEVKRGGTPGEMELITRGRETKTAGRTETIQKGYLNPSNEQFFVHFDTGLRI